MSLTAFLFGLLVGSILFSGAVVNLHIFIKQEIEHGTDS